MFSWDAMTILGLNYDECCDEQAVKRAWKHKVRLAHPDKNLCSEIESTKNTQLLNEAKDSLLERLLESVKDNESEEEELTTEELDHMKQRRTNLEMLKKYQERLDAEFASLLQHVKEAEHAFLERAAKNKKEWEQQLHNQERHWIDWRKTGRGRKLAKK